jgi:hypothetical protein
VGGDPPETGKAGFPPAVILDECADCAPAFIVFLATRPGAPPWDRAALRVRGQKGGRTRNGTSETNALEVEPMR